MRKMKRNKVILSVLEGKLEKYERRIQRISEESYSLRKLIEQLKAAKENPASVGDASPVEAK